MKKEKIGGLRAPLWECLTTDYMPGRIYEYAFVQDGYIVATNSHILVKQSLTTFHQLPPDQVEALEGKFLHMDLLKALSKCESVEFKPDGIYTKARDIRARYDYSQFNGKAPNYKVLFDNMKPEPLDALGINPGLLKKLYNAMRNGNSFGLTLTFNGKNKPIKVTSSLHTETEQVALIMPIMLND